MLQLLKKRILIFFVQLIFIESDRFPSKTIQFCVEYPRRTFLAMVRVLAAFISSAENPICCAYGNGSETEDAV